MKPTPIEPGPGQESVWNYPRPPRIEPTSRQVKVVFDGVTLACSRNSIRVLETSHSPVYYIPKRDVQMNYLAKASGFSFCEWKGRAQYFSATVNDRRVERVAWSYPDPNESFLAIKDHLAFFPSRVDQCYVDGEKVKPQAGRFYGGWITNDVVGPFKGEVGSEYW